MPGKPRTSVTSIGPHSPESRNGNREAEPKSCVGGPNLHPGRAPLAESAGGQEPGAAPCVATR
jgi:hypothetical protein